MIPVKKKLSAVLADSSIDSRAREVRGHGFESR